NEGIPDVAPGFFDATARVIRDAGGLIISDEVQPGFGRLGTHFWGHDWLGIAPDIVTVGKPMANGHPVGAVLARPDVMAAFRTAFGYFNTFGGNPVSAAACLAVLDVLRDEGLVERSVTTAAHMMDRLRALRHPMLANVRGVGMFFGAEFVTGPDMAPATDFVADVVEGMVAAGVLMNRIGRHGNTLKIRPPMPFGVAEADLLMDRLERVLADTPVPR
ncbi:MAG TPA: aminotransferase class III-fold pyridoxal phosphate-dependent enzyme, partial [Paracoccaceae bacterium]|nr:aminotransferase class III-fold pyridoxal phosphate-dependent enzyme [Paracoccaceae bacterium]